MGKISVKKLSVQELQEKDIASWPIWEKEVSVFPWHYDRSEACYVLQGKVTVTPEDGDPVTFGSGDFVEFPEGMDCTWAIHEDVQKHYCFS
ncbi:MAG: cupin domain-containing protein [Lentisphaerae bacterium]|nr:cupin domain-containing protein [Lentisphaerota bacterium]MCP4101333.1 cupin domain-containing protein [Lentisphaerota bacterium]